MYKFPSLSLSLSLYLSICLSISIRPYHPSLSARLPNSIHCPYRADVNKIQLVIQHWRVPM